MCGRRRINRHTGGVSDPTAEDATRCAGTPSRLAPGGRSLAGRANAFYHPRWRPAPAEQCSPKRSELTIRAELLSFRHFLLSDSNRPHCQAAAEILRRSALAALLAASGAMARCLHASRAAGRDELGIAPASGTAAVVVCVPDPMASRARRYPTRFNIC